MLDWVYQNIGFGLLCSSFMKNSIRITNREIVFHTIPFKILVQILFFDVGPKLPLIKDISWKGNDLEGRLSFSHRTMDVSSTAATANAECAKCGKAETVDNKLKKCKSCKIVKYCSRDCQVSHWPKHKTDCKKRAALFDEEMFKDTEEEREECPICMLPLPLEKGQSNFQVCCGKVICCGCIHAQYKEDIKSGRALEYIGVCAFCREPGPATDEMIVARLKNGMKKNIPGAFECVGNCYMEGDVGFPKDVMKGRETLLKAVELGSAEAYALLSFSYSAKFGGEGDVKQQRHYFELGAMKGCMTARHELGVLDWDTGDRKRAFKHFVISAKAGYEKSLKPIRDSYKEGYITKDEFTEILRSYQKKLEDMKSAMRDESKIYLDNPGLYWV